MKFISGSFAIGSKVCLIILNYIGRKAKRIPAATAEPITPATLGPIACIKRKLPGLNC